MTGHFDSDYDGSNITHITIERTKSHSLRTIKYTLYLNKMFNYELAYLNTVFVKFFDKYNQSGFIGEFTGNIKLFNDSYKVMSCNMSNYDYMFAILSAPKSLVNDTKFDVLEIMFKEQYPVENDRVIHNCIPYIFKTTAWTLNEVNYY